LISLPRRFEAKVSAIEESCDLKTLSVTELISKLRAYEQRSFVKAEDDGESAFAMNQKEKKRKGDERGRDTTEVLLWGRRNHYFDGLKRVHWEVFRDTEKVPSSFVWNKAMLRSLGIEGVQISDDDLLDRLEDFTSAFRDRRNGGYYADTPAFYALYETAKTIMGGDP